MTTQRHWMVRVGLAWCVVGALLAAIRPAHAKYTPDSPEVKAMVKKAIAFLENSTGESNLGRAALGALVLVKDGKGANHPVVKNALELCKKHDFKEVGEGAIYETAVALMFLCELDAVAHRAEINRYFNHLMSVQKGHGGWGYVTQGTGDTSQTQYAILSIWTAKQFGIFPQQTGAVEKVAGFLVRTQDPSGAFGYQGNEAMGGQRVPQNSTSTSMTAAGLGGLYILADLMNLGRAARRAAAQEFPPALKLIENEEPAVAKFAVRLPTSAAEQMRRSMSDGDRWFEQNTDLKFESWQGYFLYSFERYQSFKELSEGRTEIEETRWYDDVVKLLQETQLADGSWFSDGSNLVSTSLSVLALTRSTKKAIAKALQVDGELRGGKSLAGDLSKARLTSEGKVIGAVEVGSADQMLKSLENPANVDVEALAASKNVIELSDDPQLRASQMARLRRLMSTENYAARLVAARALARTGDFDNVPTLIYALTDPDETVVRAAHNALRAITRRFDEKLPKDIGIKESQERQQLVESWKRWYKSVNPAAVFVE